MKQDCCWRKVRKSFRKISKKNGWSTEEENMSKRTWDKLVRNTSFNYSKNLTNQKDSRFIESSLFSLFSRTFLLTVATQWSSRLWFTLVLKTLDSSTVQFSLWWSDWFVFRSSLCRLLLLLRMKTILAPCFSCYFLVVFFDLIIRVSPNKIFLSIFMNWF